MSPKIQYIADLDVDDRLDRELRELLSTCFTKPQDYVFKERRYFNSMPAHRWIIRGEDGALAAHLAVHERVLTTDTFSCPVGGLAEVCVHPSHRGRGYVRLLVAEAHGWMRENGYAFGALFGDPRYYSSSGYVAVTNLYCDVPDGNGRLSRQRAEGALVVSLAGVAWPKADVAYLPGLCF